MFFRQFRYIFTVYLNILKTTISCTTEHIGEMSYKKKIPPFWSKKWPIFDQNSQKIFLLFSSIKQNVHLSQKKIWPKCTFCFIEVILKSKSINFSNSLGPPLVVF